MIEREEEKEEKKILAVIKKEVRKNIKRQAVSKSKRDKTLSMTKL